MWFFNENKKKFNKFFNMEPLRSGSTNKFDVKQFFDKRSGNFFVKVRKKGKPISECSEWTNKRLLVFTRGMNKKYFLFRFWRQFNWFDIWYWLF